MKKYRIPATWLQLHRGDQIGSRLPLHRIDAMIAQLAADGWHLRTAPSEYGYWIICEGRPTDQVIVSGNLVA
jgi:hypothetical protein